MSSLPGYDLEDYVAWYHDVVIEDHDDPNLSLQLAELCGTANRVRPRLTAEAFAPVLSLYEPYREEVENRLLDFDEDTSWRNYSCYAFDFIPESVDDAASELLKQYR